MRRYLTTQDPHPTERGSYQWALVATGFWAWATEHENREEPATADVYPYFEIVDVARGSQSVSDPPQ